MASTYVEHQKMLDQSVNQQKVAEIGQFLNSSQEFYPIVAEFIQVVKAGSGKDSAQQKRLIENLNKQYSALEVSASYLSGTAKGNAVLYQKDLVELIRTARVMNGPLDAKPFVDTLNVAVPKRCAVTKSLRRAANLPSTTIDPSCRDQA